MFQIENSIPAIFCNQVEKYGNNKGFASYKKNGIYVDLSWAEIDHLVKGCSAYLKSKGAKAGDKIAIFASNRYEWWVADLAIQALGCIVVPVYGTNTEAEAEYVLKHAEVKICFTGNQTQFDKVKSLNSKNKILSEIIIFDDINDKDGRKLTDVIAEGHTHFNEKDYYSQIEKLKDEDLVTIMYTSGTTGQPKGVMLSHKNIVSNVRQLCEVMPMTPDDVWFSFLPLSHALERTTGYYTPLAVGAKVGFISDYKSIQEDLKLVRPTVFICVPRLFEKFHAGIKSNISQAKGIKRILVKWSLHQASRNVPYASNAKKRTGLFALKFKIADKLVLSKLREALGMDRSNFYVSGGGPLSVEDLKFFVGLGVCICEGFGLTETAPVTNVNLKQHIVAGTVGPALPGTSVKISDEGEVLFKGPQVMIGYYKNDEATKEVFTEDGFFKSGDIGTIDEFGCLAITGRIKDIIVTSGGKNISPQNIENAIKASKYIEQLSLIGDRRRFISALIIPNFDEVKKYAGENNILFSTKEDLYQNESIIKLFEIEIDKYSRDFARVEQVKKFILLPNEWTQDTGELTPKQSIKRKTIEKKYADIIEQLYADESGSEL